MRAVAGQQEKFRARTFGGPGAGLGSLDRVVGYASRLRKLERRLTAVTSVSDGVAGR